MAFTLKMQSSEQSFDAGFESESGFGVKFEAAQMVSTGDHRMLSNRDAPDQHPIGAITRLQAELDVRSSERITNAEIDEILRM